VKLRELERLVQGGRTQALGSVEKAARRRETARAELQRRLSALGRTWQRLPKNVITRITL